MGLTYAQKFVGGMLGLLALSIGANLYMISLAVKSQDGMVTANYYERGLHYNLEKPQTANPMGWTVRVQAPSAIQQKQIFAVNLADRSQKPLPGAEVSLELFRPNKEGFDQKTQLREIAPGRYEAPMTIPLAGNWLASLHVEKGSERYDYSERLKIGMPDAAALGWQIKMTPPARAGQPDDLVVTLQDRGNRPLSGGHATVDFFAPNQGGLSQNVNLREVSPGRYLAKVALPSGGVWNTTLHFQVGNERIDHDERLSIGAPRS